MSPSERLNCTYNDAMKHSHCNDIRIVRFFCSYKKTKTTRQFLNLAIYEDNPYKN